MRLATRAARVASLLLFVARALPAGEQITAEFKDKRAVSPEALRQVPLKSVVTEFLDIQASLMAAAEATAGSGRRRARPRAQDRDQAPGG